jgi:hypothetical protein
VAHKEELPEWGRKVLPRLSQLAAKVMKLSTSTNDLKRLEAGPLLGNFLENMKRKLENPGSKKRAFFFSAHESTLAKIMNSLGVFKDRIIPPYSAALIFELHKSFEETEPFVKVMSPSCWYLPLHCQYACQHQNIIPYFALMICAIIRYSTELERMEW